MTTARREPIPATTYHRIDPMTGTYRVEAHDGKRWRFGIRMNANKGTPEFCSVEFADQFNTRADAIDLAAQANRLCGGSLRVARVCDEDGSHGPDPWLQELEQCEDQLRVMAAEMLAERRESRHFTT